jgi:hypothetical protein
VPPASDGNYRQPELLLRKSRPALSVSVPYKWSNLSLAQK